MVRCSGRARARGVGRTRERVARDESEAGRRGLVGCTLLSELDRRHDATHGCTAPHPSRPRTAPPHLPPPPPLVLLLLLVLLLDSSASPPTNRPSVRTRTHTHRAAPHPARARRQAARGAGHQTRAVPQPTLGRQGAPSQGQAEPRRVARRLAQPRKAPPGTTTLVRLVSLSLSLSRSHTRGSELTRVEGGDCAARDRVKQASRGYFHDYNELRQQGGKAFVAPKTLIREDVRPLALVRRTFATALDRPDPARRPQQLALYFPDIEGVSLATKDKVHTTDLFEDKVSLVVFSSFRSSEVRSLSHSVRRTSCRADAVVWLRRSTSTALCGRRWPT